MPGNATTVLGVLEPVAGIFRSTDVGIVLIVVAVAVVVVVVF